ncbi:hypothetical protein B0H17DRAFT_1205238 [Mycena rosella]|uniref:FBD domain-containing protein n=1 Tax=Mycena rosella TaxID=1033263 RepID=A0AAD7GF55_MYCRO|nr:hypothetical protein B0H17DRAFT_1205238 [Mycena rosella]
MPNALVSLVRSFAGQIQRLDLHLMAEQFSRLRPLHASFPLLQHLATSHSSSEDLSYLLQDAPSIRELRLLGDTSSIKFSLPLLTHLEIEKEISKDTFLAILTNFPSLSHFKFHLTEYESHSITEISIPTTFPNLTSLTVGSGCSALHLLQLPNLHKLDLPSFFKPDIIRPFLARSSCPLDHLVISFEGYDEDGYGDDVSEEVTNLLKTFPLVVVLEITRCPDVSVLISCLESPGLLPRLSELTISAEIGPQTPDMDYDAIIGMLHRRRDSARAVELRKFHLNMTCLGQSSSDDVEDRCPGYLVCREIIGNSLDFVLGLAAGGKHYTWPPNAKGDSLVFFCWSIYD